jgi:hypothetical protein
MTMLDEIRREAERLDEDVLYAEKQHFAMASVWRRIHLWLGIPSAILAGLAGISALNSYPIIAAALAILSGVITALLTFLDPANSSNAHHQAGISYSGLRGRFRRLHNIESGIGHDAASLSRRLEELATEKLTIMKNSPHIGGLAYRLGKASIDRKEHENIVDQR